MFSEIGRWWRYVKHLWKHRNWYERLAMFYLHALVFTTFASVAVFLIIMSVVAAATFWQVALALALIVVSGFAVWVVNRD